MENIYKSGDKYFYEDNGKLYSCYITSGNYWPYYQGETEYEEHTLVSKGGGKVNYNKEKIVFLRVVVGDNCGGVNTNISNYSEEEKNVITNLLSYFDKRNCNDNGGYEMCDIVFKKSLRIYPVRSLENDFNPLNDNNYFVAETGFYGNGSTEFITFPGTEYGALTIMNYVGFENVVSENSEIYGEVCEEN